MMLPFAEVSIPRFENSLPRARLHTKLQESLQRKLTMLIAPPGYGKTTLLAHFAASLKMPVVWQTLTQYDCDLNQLIHNATAAFRETFSQFPEMQLSQAIPSSELAAMLVERIRETTQEEVVYILDDIQHLLATGGEKWLQALIMQLPATCHIIIAGQALPHLPIRELLTQGDVGATQVDALHFTVEEVQELATLFGVPLSFEQCSSIHTSVGGWPAGTVLALRQLTDKEHLVELSPEKLFNVLAEQVFEQQPPHIQRFLLMSSVLPMLTNEICSEVLDMPNAIQYLMALYNQGMFLSLRMGAFRYHTLFAGFLRQRLYDQDPAAFKALHAAIAKYALKHDQIDVAFTHYLEADMIGHSAQLAETYANSLFVQGRSELLLSWLNALKTCSAQSARLWYFCAIILTERYELPHAETLLDEAEQFLEFSEDLTGLAIVHVQKARILLYKGAYSQAIETARKMVNADVSRNTQQRAQAMHILGLAHLYSGDIYEAGSYLESAVEESRLWDDPNCIATLLQDLYVVYIRMGQLEAAAACLQEAVAIRRQLGSTSALALILNNLGYHYHQYGEYERASETFEEGLRLVVKATDKRTESALLWSMGDLKRDLGKWSEATNLYTRALRQISYNDPQLRSLILLSLATLQRWQNDCYGTQQTVAEIMKLTEKHRLHLERLQAHAQILILNKSNSTRLDELYEVANQLGENKALAEQLIILAFCVQTALETGEEVSALDFLCFIERMDGVSLQFAATELYHHERSQTLILSHSSRIPKLAQCVINVKNAQADVQIILPHFTLNTQTLSLQITSLGVEKIMRDSQAIANTMWRATRAKELFFYLLIHGPTTREYLYDTLWSESSSEQARGSFHTTLFRVRQALGNNVIVFEDEIYRLNPDVNIQWDVDQFRHLYAQTKKLSLHDMRTSENLRRALALYQGVLLPNLSQDWVISLREHLQRQYMELLLMAGDCTRMRYEYTNAIELYKTALSIDPYYETAYRQIMTCYAKLGERAQVLRVYQKLKKRLHLELNIMPSAETTELMNILLG